MLRRSRVGPYGLVTQALPESQLDSVVEKTCAELSKGSHQGLRETKQLLGASLAAHIDAGSDEMASLSARLFGSPVAKEAMLAFLSRKTPA
jgi:1,4-dihydroxy-2-naphthoyl-CoA synthase